MDFEILKYDVSVGMDDFESWALKNGYSDFGANRKCT